MWGNLLFNLTDKSMLAAVGQARNNIAIQMPPARLDQTSDCRRDGHPEAIPAAVHASARLPRLPRPEGRRHVPIQSGPYSSLHPPSHNVPRALDNAYLACTATDRIPMRAS
jgi:hypothetical protein